MYTKFQFLIAGVCTGILISFTSLTSAQEQKPGLVVVARPGMGKASQYLHLYLENTTDQPIELIERHMPSWTVKPWFDFKVEGQPLEIPYRAAYALHFPAAKKVLPPKSKTFFGTAILRTSAKNLEWGYAPILDLKPGKHLIEISSKVAAKSAKLELTVLEKTMPPNKEGVIGKGKTPLLISLSQGLTARKALAIFVHLHNLTDEEFLFSHDGLEPPWHTAPWFAVEIDGKPYQPKIPPVEFKKKGGTLTIRPLSQGLRGEFLIPLPGFDAEFYKKNHYFSPLLRLSSGKHVIRVIPTKRWQQAGISPPAPASIEVEVK